MTQMCPTMLFEWSVECGPVPDPVPKDSPPWRFTFDVVFTVLNQAGGS